MNGEREASGSTEDATTATSTEAAGTPGNGPGLEATACSQGRDADQAATTSSEGVERAHELLLGVRLSVRYHTRRRAWFESWHSALLIASIGLASVGRVGSLDQSVLTLSILAIGFILAVTLVVGHARKATLHGALAARFRDLEATFAHQKELTQEEFRELNERRLAIEVDEPSPKRLLSALCYFEVLRSTRSDLDIAAELKKVPWWRRRAAQILSQTEWMVEKLQTPKTVEPAPGR